MIAGGVELQLLIILTQAVGGSTVTDSAGSSPAPPKFTEARIDPDSARARIQQLLVQAATSGGAGATGAVDSAARIARAIARPWGDSFPLSTVDRFAAWTSQRRRGKVRADSLRLAGNEVFGREGPRAALTLWIHSVAEAEAAGDSAGVAAGWGNVGSGWLAASEPDSATTYLERSRRMAIAIGDHRTAGNALGALANVAKAGSRLAEARTLYQRAGKYRERAADTRGMAADLNNLGLISEALGELDSAALLYRRALALNRRFERDGPAATNLVNLGNLASLRGAYGEAASSYTAALGIRRSRGERPEQATVLYDLGLLGVRRGDYPGAMTHLRESVALYEQAGLVDGAVAARIALSSLCMHLGQVQEAVKELRTAERLAGGDGLGPETRAELALVAAELVFALNDLPEAEQSYDEAARLYGELGDLAGQAAAAEGHGFLLLRRQQPARAHPYLARALDLRTQQGDLRGAAVARLLSGYAHLRMGDTPTARLAYDSSLVAFRRLDDRVGEAAALDALGGFEILAGNASRAESRFAEGLKRLGTLQSPVLSWSLRSGLADALQRKGEVDRAAGILRNAIDEIEQVRGLIPLEEWRAGYLADKWSVYGQLVRLEHQRGRAASAFDVSERMRARQMLDQLSNGRIEPASLPPELASEEQDLRRRIAELVRGAEDQALRPLARRETSSRADDLSGDREELNRAQAAYARLLGRIREASPAYAALVSGATISSAKARERLRDGDAILDYLVLDSVTIIFALTADTIRSLEVPVTREALAGMVDFTRDLIAGPVSKDRREPWRAPLKRLHRALVEPAELAGLLSGKQRLVIVPHAELHYLPFAALISGGHRETFLVERFEVAFAPSVSSWVHLGNPPSPRRTNTVLAVAPHSASLPGTLSEVAGIRHKYGPRAVTLLNEDATEDRFRLAASRHDIVHLATYGVLNQRNPLFSFVQLRPDTASDGRLEVHEAYRLNLRAKVLILSACETGLASGAIAEVPAGDDWVGLVQAFLQAGAESVVATLWSVDDRATAQLIDAFYAQLIPTRSTSTALAQAQRLILGAKETRAPFYWAGFTLNGSLSQ